MEFTEEQSRVIHHTHGNCVVIAGAGSGKTRCLVERTARLIDVGYDPNRILVFTFTKKAAHEIKCRIAKRLETDVEDLNVASSTIHSLALRIFRENKSDLNFESNVTIWDPSRRGRVIKQIVNDFKNECSYSALVDSTYKAFDGEVFVYPFSDESESTFEPEKAKFFEQIEEGIALAIKKKLPHPEKIDDKTPLAYYLELIEERVDKLVATILAEFKKTKGLCSVIEFDDMLPAAVKILKQGKCKYVNFYQHIMVDEYQDVNQSNVDFVEALMGSDTVSLMAVGDDDQSIYGFRGGDVEHILHFTDKDKFGGEVLYLTNNFRSSPEIVGLANQLISHNKNRYDKEMVATRQGSFPEHWKIEPFYNIYKERLNAEQTEQYSEVFAYIEGLIHFVGVEPKDIVILARNNYNLRMAYHRFKKCNIIRERWFQKHSNNTWEDIRFDISNLKSPFENKIIKDALLWANLLLNPKDFVAGREALMATEKGFGGKTAIYLGKSAIALPDSDIVGWLRDLKKYPRHGEKTKKYKMIKELSDKIEMILGKLHQMDFIAFWECILQFAKYKERISRLRVISPNNGEPARGLTADEAEIAQADCKRAIQNFVHELEKPEDQYNHQLMMDMIMTEINIAHEQSGVQMMTIHASKGKEWPYVFIIDLVKDVLPSDRCENIEEERRLFYVGITRAEEQVIFSHFEIDKHQRFNEPSIFLSEIR